MKLDTLKKHRNTTVCEKCGSPNGLTVEHRIPKTFLSCFDMEKVADNRNNLRVFCSPCNSAKGNYIDLTDQWTWDTIQRILKYAKEQQDIFTPDA